MIVTIGGNLIFAVVEADRLNAYGSPVEFIVDSVERVRFVNSDTEATVAAARLASGVTGRDRIVVMENGYHGETKRSSSRERRIHPIRVAPECHSHLPIDGGSVDHILRTESLQRRGSVRKPTR